VSGGLHGFASMNFTVKGKMKQVKVLLVVTGAIMIMLFSSLWASGAPRVTFVELGAKSCTPCKLMQPVMRSLENRYGERLKVVFYDVSTPKGRPFAIQYAIRIIPTQVFLDEKGKEFFRHEGFFPETEIDKLLKQRGVISIN
jgi:thioredoxin 1